MEGVRQAIVAREEDDSDDESGEVLAIAGTTGRIPGLADLSIPPELQIDLSVIPITDVARMKMGEQIASLEYEIGNVFYLNLSMPDSALYRYLRVVEEFPESEVRAQAMYSIADIYIASGEEDVAKEWAMAIIDEYPATVMARRIAERLQIDADLTEVFISEDEVAERDYLNILSTLVDAEPLDRIHRLGSFLERFPEAPQRPNALFNKAVAYAELGRSDRNFAFRFDRRMQLQAEWSAASEEFEIERRKASEMLADTTLAETDVIFWKSIADSTLIEPEFADYFPYVGADWDSTRVYLQMITEKHPQSGVRERSMAMLQTVQLPASLRRAPSPGQPVDTLLATADLGSEAPQDAAERRTVDAVPATVADTAIAALPDSVIAVIADTSIAARVQEQSVSEETIPDTEVVAAIVDSLVAAQTDQVGLTQPYQPAIEQLIVSELAPIKPPADVHSRLPFPDYPILGYRIGTDKPDDALLHWENEYRYFMQVIITTYTGASMRRNYLTELPKDSTLTLLPQYRPELRIRWLLGSGYYRDFSHAFQAVRSTGADMSKQFIELYHYIDSRLYGVEPDLDPESPAFSIRLGQFEQETDALRYLEAWKALGMNHASIFNVVGTATDTMSFEIRTGKYTDRITAELLSDIVYERSGFRADVVTYADR
jgi:tetratricopeptide (TPR) repeat protein